MQVPSTMRAMVLKKPRSPLQLISMPVPSPAEHQVLVKVSACGVCRTDLHIVDGELNRPKLPLIPGHEIIGTVAVSGAQVKNLKPGDAVGIPWLGFTCGTCRYCRRGHENLCEQAGFTGYTIDGGYAEFTVANQDYCFPLPKDIAHPAGAPLLCAGLIGYRSYKMAGTQVKSLGIYGFGAAAHILVQVAKYENKEVFAFARPGDREAIKFALQMGANWAGDSNSQAPSKLDAAIIFAPAGELIPKALEAVDKAGVVVCGGIHMSDIPSFPYRLLWEERVIRSVANLSRNDAVEFLAIAPKVPVRTEVRNYPLVQANEALDDVRAGRIHGAAVLVMD